MSNFFMNIPPRTRETKAKMNKWDYIKLKSFCTAKYTIPEQKGNLQYGRIFVNDSFNKGLTTKICKGVIYLNTKETNSPIKKWVED